MTLDKIESEKYFHNALCNAVGSGYMNGYGIELVCDDADYKKAKSDIVTSGVSPCYEDVLMQVLRNGGKLTFEDVEGEGDMTRSITINDVHDKVSKTPINHLTDMMRENDDATTADVILQTVFFDEVVFG